MATRQHPVRYFVEYAAVRSVGAFLNILPLAVAQGIAWGLARFAYVLPMRSRVREARRRMRLVLGENFSDREIRRASWLSLRNTAFNLVDMLRVRKFSRARLVRMIDGMNEAIARIRSTLEKSGGRGAILALPHCGNWDLAGTAVFLSGLPIFSVAGKQRNPWMNKFINKMREGKGMDVLERGDAGGRTYLAMLRRIRGGDIFAILPDSRSRTPALSVPFLGGDANLARGMGLLACQAGVPIVPLVMRRTAWRKFSVEFFPTLWPDQKAVRDDEELRLTREVVGHFDAAIKATPEQWFWYNKRWVLDPVEQ